MSTTLIKNGTIVTMDPQRRVLQGDLLLRDGRIQQIAASIAAEPGTSVIDATDTFVIPGLIQAHIHLCQTLFRGDADDLSLLDWLTQRIWPMEAAHNEASLRASAQVGLLELGLSGTTTILDMGTVRHTHSLLATAEESGLRYFGGKCLMDHPDSSGPLFEDYEASLRETEELIRTWHRKSELLNYALCPRFAISSTRRMLETCRDLQSQHGLLVHTHASENKDEVRLIREQTGMDNIEYFHHLNLLSRQTVIAHGIHLSETEIDQIVENHACVVHCPSSNLKLGSGIARIHHYLKKQMRLALGADGAPCNNSLDPFIEMRLAALLQKPHFGPESLPARSAFELATIRGADAVGLADQIGSLEVGKQADVVIIRRDDPSVATVTDPYSALVYSCTGRDVRDVFIRGTLVVRDRQHQIWDRTDVLQNARNEHQKLLSRI